MPVPTAAVPKPTRPAPTTPLQFLEDFGGVAWRSGVIATGSSFGSMAAGSGSDGAGTRLDATMLRPALPVLISSASSPRRLEAASDESNLTPPSRIFRPVATCTTAAESQRCPADRCSVRAITTCSMLSRWPSFIAFIARVPETGDRLRLKGALELEVEMNRGRFSHLDRSGEGEPSVPRQADRISTWNHFE